MEKIKKNKISLKHSDMANLFNAYLDDNNNSIFYCGRTVDFGDMSKFNAKYITKHFYREGDTWHRLAYKYYGNAKLWWIVCRANNITNPFEYPEIGNIIYIPNKNIAQQVLNTLN